TSRTCAFSSPRSVADASGTTEFRFEMRLPGLPEGKPPRVERGRPELGSELVERGERVLGEHVFHHTDLAVVGERDVDAWVRDEVERQTAATRAAHREPHRPVRGREQRERGRKDGTRLLLGVAVEAPRPLAALDVHCGELAELGPGGIETRSHEVEEFARAE